MKIEIKDGKKFVNIGELHEWEKNPRSISKEGFERLKKQITTLGQHTPLIVRQDGTVVSGNMRLKAFNALGFKDIWVEVIPPEKDHLYIEYAMSANDRAGKYEEDQLADLIGNFPDVEWGDFAIDSDDPKLMSDIINKFDLPEDEEVPRLDEKKLVTCPECGAEFDPSSS